MTKYEKVLNYLSEKGKITNIEVIQVASTTSPQKVMQKLVSDGLVKSEKAPNKSYHIYSLIDNQLRLI